MTNLLFLFVIVITNFKIIFSQIDKPLKLDGIGRGWDYLLDEGRLSPFKITYENDQTTGGDRYLIPDCASSYIDSFTRYDPWTEIIESGSNYTSLNSRSFGLNGGVTLGKFNLSFGFSYSKEYVNTMSKQKQEISITIRIMFLQQRYNVLINRRCPLNDFFIKDIEEIVNQLGKNQTDMATFLSQQLISDYGTHVLNNVIYGGIIFKEDYIKMSYWNNMQSKIDTVKKSASFGFQPFINTGVSSSQVSQNDLNEYRNSTTNSGLIIAKGGIYKPNNNILDDWIESLDRNLADIDRKGILLSDLITQDAFPAFSSSAISETRKHIESAILSYLLVNTKVGCMDRKSVKFDFSANFHDKRTCASSVSTVLPKFGGIIGREVSCINSCFTGSCPSGYAYNTTTLNLLNNIYGCPVGYQQYDVYFESCSWWRWIIYQCVSVGENVNFQGMYFGGIYSSKLDNPVTGLKSCPVHFTAQRLLTKRTDTYICLSISEYAKDYSVDFGGFISTDTLISYNPWTGGKFDCPLSYKKYFAFSLNAIEVYYCVKMKETETVTFEYTSMPLMERPQITEDFNAINNSRQLFVDFILLITLLIIGNKFSFHVICV